MQQKKEYWFNDLGNFLAYQCQGVKEKMDGKSFMNFEVVYSNNAGNCTLGIKTAYEDEEQTIKNFFLYCLISELTEDKKQEKGPYPVRTIKESRINGRSVYLHSICTEVGEMFVVEHEDQAYELITDGLFRDDPDKAEKTYYKVCKRILKTLGGQSK